MVGVPGVGKTSLAKEAAKSLGYHYINYGELMLEFAKKGKYASNQEEMFKLSLELQYDIWLEAAHYIRDLTEDKEDCKGLTKDCKNPSYNKDSNGILVDLHGLDRSKKGYLISLPLEIFKPQIIIVVESTYNHIIQRRINDQERKRLIEGWKSLNQEMELLRNSMVICSTLLGSYFVVMKNQEFEKSLIRLKKYL